MARSIKHIIIAAPGKGIGKGGVIRQMQYLVEEGKKHPESGIVFHWLCTHSGNKFWPIYFIIPLMKLIWLKLQGKADLLHLNIASYGSFYRKYMLYRLAKILGIPHLAHLHGGGFLDFYAQGSARRKSCIEALFQQAQSVLVLGKASLSFAKEIGVSADRCHLLPNAVPTPPQVSKGGGEVPHLVFAGHLIERKGVGDLIEALAMLKELSWRATLAGSGEEARFKQQADDAGLADRIDFPGWLDDAGIQALYQEADIMVLPSHIENQPLCILEAMAHGLAIVTTDVGTVREMVTENTALVTKVSQNSELAKSLRFLLENPAEIRSMAEAGHAHHLKHSSLKQYFNEYSKII
jgi:glycosyltransferase involved in cell wall biosynthesis